MDNLASLDHEILLHHQHDKNEGVLTSLLARVWDGGSSQSLKQMEALADQADAARTGGDTAALQRLDQTAQQSVKSDKEALASCETKLGYATGALKTVGLFMGNKYGLAATLAVYGLDNAKAGDKLKGQIEDGLLGAGKGLALRKTFEFAGNRGWGPIEQGVSIGFLSRFSDLTLTRSTYKHGFFNGLGNSVKKAADPRSLAIDAGTFVLARGMFGGLNAASQGRIAASRMFSTMATGAAFGATTGATSELVRQRNSGEGFNLGKVLKSGLIQGSIDTFAAAPGGAMSGRAAVGQDFSGRNVESGAKPESLKETPLSGDPAGKPAREFVLTGGQDTLNKFLSGEHDQQGAMLRVREVMARDQMRLGSEKSLFVQHLGKAQDAKTINAATLADIVASCIPEGSRVPLNHVLPEAAGPIRLNANAAGDRIAFTTGDTTAPGYERSVELGEQSGEKFQRELFTWTTMKNGKEIPGLDAELIEARQTRDEMQQVLDKGNWAYFETGKRSAADQVGMDIILMNRNDGRWTFFDTTLDPNAKKDAALLRQPGIIVIEREDGSVSLRTRLDLMNRVISATQSESPFNTRDVKPPSWDASMNEADQAAEVARFRKQIADKVGRLRTQSASEKDSTEQWFLQQQAEDLQNYDEDVARAQEFVKKAAGEAADPEYPRHLSAAKVQVKQTARDLIGPMIARGQLSPEHGNGSVKTRVVFDKQYDELEIWAGGQRFQIKDASKLVAEAIEAAVNKKDIRDFDYKRRLLSGSTAESVTRAVVDRLERMWSGKIIGEPGLKDPPPPPLGKKKGPPSGRRW